MKDKRINRIEQDSPITEYINGGKIFPKEIGSIKLEGEKSNNEISYFSWDILFNEDTDANRPNNSGIDEMQIMFNLTRDIEWKILSDKSGTFTNKTVLLKKGEVCVVRNNDASTGMRYMGNCTFKFKSLQMPTERFEDLIDQFFEREDAFRIKDMLFKDVLKATITPEMYRAIDELDSLDKYKEYKGVLLEGKVMELTALVLHAIAYQKNEEKDVSLNADSDDVRALERLRESIRLRPYETYMAEDMAQSLNMSVSKLNRVFRNLYGTSLHAFVQVSRLEYAADLLKAGNCTVTEAALKAGYNNMSYFSKAFFEHFKISPKKYSKL